MNRQILIPFGEDLYEFDVSPELEVVEIRVSRGNCNHVPVTVDAEDLPEGMEDKLFEQLMKLS